MKPIPSEVNLIQVNNSGEEISQKKLDPDRFSFNIHVDEEAIGKQYAVHYLWKEAEKIKGTAVLNFKLR